MDNEFNDPNELSHIGTSYSGRYPKGSGKEPLQRPKEFLDFVDSLKKKGLSPIEIAKGVGLETTTKLRRRVSLANDAQKAADFTLATTLKAKGLSAGAIAKQLGMPNESSVRSLLNRDIKARSEVTNTIANMLKDTVGKGDLVDVGVGQERYLNVSRTKLETALEKLEIEGYEARPIYVPQLGTGGNKKTTMLVLSAPGTPYADLYKRQADIKMVIPFHSEDGGVTSHPIEFPKSVSIDRVGFRYAEQKGAEKDGVIELRRGVDELSLGDSSYAQVRIAVGGTHYLKGMAMYSDDLPKGIDILVNSNKSEALGKAGSMKKLKPVSDKDPTIDPDFPFGATIKVNGQRHYIDSNGKEQLSPINKVNEEGDWNDWNKSLSSQFLSKQPVSLAKQQLGAAYDIKKEEYDTISLLTNPTIKKKLLEEFADSCDSSSVHLKAAAMPRQASQVLLPITNMKETEIYAPNFRPGESVILVRYPHGGTFEIPSLTVNNNQRTAKSLIGQAQDAVGISPKVAERLSGADFDGDSVLVIPNPGGKTIQTSAALKGLVDFDAKTLYAKYDGMPEMTSHTKQMEMGKISNLITDMTIKGATPDKICKAVKHSMVVIDAEKHHLDYKRSYIDNGIAALKKEYQDSKGGASTLLSKASSDLRVNLRKEKTVYKAVKNMTPSELVDHNKGKKIMNMTPSEYADYNNGKKVYEYTGESYFKPLTTTLKRVEKDVSAMSPSELTKYNSGKKVYMPKVTVKIEKNVSDMTPEELAAHKVGKKIYKYSTTPTYKTTVSSKMAEEDDAFNLSSGTLMESIYATHANKLKALANEARKANLSTPSLVYSHAASIAYKPEVDRLKSALNIALKNAPLERQAMLLANAKVSAKRAANPDMEKSDIKKINGQALTQARLELGSKKETITISDREWEAIQAGAISDNKLQQILNNTKPEVVKQLAMPRLNTKSGLTPATEARVRSMLASGTTQRDIADVLGLSLSTINTLAK